MSEHLTDSAPPAASKDRSANQYAGEGLGHVAGETVVGQAVTINRSATELFSFFRDFANLPAFMENVARVEVLDDERSRWAVKAPGGNIVEWTSSITDLVPGTLIAWASEKGADVPNRGRIDFRPAGARGTVVTATIVYDPPAGAIGRLVAKLFQREPAIQARRDLRRFKQLMETGEVATAARTRRAHDEEKG
ncbi:MULTISPECIES: SRPBCC family protein [Sphingomonas]|uniref:SRPBCC family protein n=1 Tax=Sphingomonas TaxID=13687 RepID=UPI000AF7BDCE|nr:MULTISPECIES: SRPBCC family protein [Sphingomonas]MCW6530319.1 SRPBCC family protein [Sphingomonas lycopersici]